MPLKPLNFALTSDLKKLSNPLLQKMLELIRFSNDALEVEDIAGTEDQVIVTDNGDGTLTFSLPQDIATDSTPTFAGLNLETGELTVGSINRASGTLTLEIGGTAKLSLSSDVAQFGASEAGYEIKAYGDEEDAYFQFDPDYLSLILHDPSIGDNTLLESFNIIAGGDNTVESEKCLVLGDSNVIGEGANILCVGNFAESIDDTYGVLIVSGDQVQAGDISTIAANEAGLVIGRTTQGGSSAVAVNIDGGAGSLVVGVVTGITSGSAKVRAGGASKYGNIAIGAAYTADGNSASVDAKGVGCIAIGYASANTANDSMVSAQGIGSAAFGYCANKTTKAYGNNSFAFGSGVILTHNQCFGFGADFTDTDANQFLIGWTATPTLQVINGKIGINKMPSTCHLEFADGSTQFIISLGSTYGTKIGTASTEKLAFYGENPVVRPAAPTADLSGGLTVNGPSTPDYELSETDSSPWGFGSQDEIRSFMSQVENNRVRIGEIQGILQALGLIP